MLAVGIDGWKASWVAVALRDGRFAGAAVGSLAALVDRHPEAAAIGVDIPIGLPEAGARKCDLEARLRVGARRNSVFLTPSRAALCALTYHAARAAVAGVSAQAYRLGAKIFEAEAIADPRLHEVHPELAFATMAGHHLPHAKKTWAGLWDRLELLRAQGIELPADAGEAAVVAPDDLVDAAAVAWSATRITSGTAGWIGDEVGRIWF